MSRPRASSGDPVVRVGSIWRDNDPRRQASRRCKVLAVGAGGAVLVQWLNIGPRQWRQSLVKLSRFSGRANAYSLVQQARRR